VVRIVLWYRIFCQQHWWIWKCLQSLLKVWDNNNFHLNFFSYFKLLTSIDNNKNCIIDMPIEYYLGGFKWVFKIKFDLNGCVPQHVVLSLVLKYWRCEVFLVIRMGFCCTNYCMQLMICLDDGCGIIHSWGFKKECNKQKIAKDNFGFAKCVIYYK
jgi:hypothetical protein